MKSTVLSKVIEFCSHHHNNPMREIEKVRSILDSVVGKVAERLVVG